MPFAKSALRDPILYMCASIVAAKSYDELIDKSKDDTNAYQLLDPFPLKTMLLNLSPFYVLSIFISLFLSDGSRFEISEVILSGSWSEGLVFYDSINKEIPDLDQMYVLKHISFSEIDQQAGNLTLRQDTPFADAYITDEDALKMWSSFLDDEGNSVGKRLSSKKLKEELHRKHYERILNSDDDNSNNVGTGAAISIKPFEIMLSNMRTIINEFPVQNLVVSGLDERIYDCQKLLLKTSAGCDIVLSISCEGWPSCAKEWKMRDRIWPSDDLVEEITHSGFHIVPKSSTEGDFRLSFSCAETTLIENLTELQHKVLRSFKAVVKHHQNTWSVNIKEIITTYHLKTVAFWHFEKIPQNSFTEESVSSHLVLLLQELAEALRKRELPLYFMPKVNLFQNVNDHDEAINIADKIEQLRLDVPRIINAADNITFVGFGQLSSFLENMTKVTKTAFNLLRDKERGGEILSHEAIHEMSTVLDSVRKILGCNLLNPVANVKLATHKEEEETRATRLAMGCKSNVQDACLFDTKEFIDLD